MSKWSKRDLSFTERRGFGGYFRAKNLHFRVLGFIRVYDQNLHFRVLEVVLSGQISKTEQSAENTIGQENSS